MMTIQEGSSPPLPSSLVIYRGEKLLRMSMRLHPKITEPSPLFFFFLHRLRGSILLAATACVLRPTNALIWICITYFTLFGSSSSSATTARTPFRWSDLTIWSSVPSLDLLSSIQRKRKTLVREIIRNGYVTVPPSHSKISYNHTYIYEPTR